jgi:hypothetical protein
MSRLSPALDLPYSMGHIAASDDPDNDRSRRTPFLIVTRRTRKLIGTVAIFAFVVAYGPIAMALAESRILEAPKSVQALAYLVLGLVWIFPLMPLIRWMVRPDADRA